MATRIEHKDGETTYWYDNPEIGWVQISEQCYDTMQYFKPVLKDKDGKAIGTVMVFGTAGDLPHEDLEKIFRHPESYVFQKKEDHKPVFKAFIPAYKNDITGIEITERGARSRGKRSHLIMFEDKYMKKYILHDVSTGDETEVSESIFHAFKRKYGLITVAEVEARKHITKEEVESLGKFKKMWDNELNYSFATYENPDKDMGVFYSERN